MARFSCFVDPGEFLDLLSSLADVAFIGRRFADAGLPVGYWLIDRVDAATYEAEGFVELVISAGGVPRAPDDWGFLEREAPDLLIVEGGRLNQGVLEIWNLRTFSKQSNMVSRFSRIKRMVKSLDGESGYEHESGTFYRDIFVADSARRYSLKLR